MTSEIHLNTAKSSCTILPTRGGLISSLVIEGRELLWMSSEFSQGDSSWPGGGLPLCFPFAGRVWHQGQLHQYGLEDTAYHMPIHGFAYGEPWQIISTSKTQSTIELKDSERTRVIFPFSFRVQLSLTLTENSLQISFQVKYLRPTAKAPKMPVALGFHPYFKLPHGEELTLDLDAQKYYPVTPTGAAGKAAPGSDLGPSPWPIASPLLNSLILTDFKNPTAALKTNDGQKYIKIKFGPESMFHHIVVWTNQPKEFYCVEPWMSLPDAVAIPSGGRWLDVGEEISGFFEILL